MCFTELAQNDGLVNSHVFLSELEYKWDFIGQVSKVDVHLDLRLQGKKALE